MTIFESFNITILLAEPLREDFCGVEPITHPPDIMETRPPPTIDEDKLRQIYQRTDSAILGGKYIKLILMIMIKERENSYSKTLAIYHVHSMFKSALHLRLVTYCIDKDSVLLIDFTHSSV